MLARWIPCFSCASSSGIAEGSPSSTQGPVVFAASIDMKDIVVDTFSIVELCGLPLTVPMHITAKTANVEYRKDILDYLKGAYSFTLTFEFEYNR